MQRPDSTAAVGEAGDGLQRLPDADGCWQCLDRPTQRLDGVGVAIDRMPPRHEAAGFGKEEKENAVDHDQRFIKCGDGGGR